MRFAVLFCWIWISSGVLLSDEISLSYIPVSIPTRDDKVLSADLYYCDPEPMARPVILIQTPYNKNLYRKLVDDPFPEGGPLFPLDENYNYVIVDWRGFFGSADADVPGYDRGLDGFDTVEWIAAQPWCNGMLGTWGSSALGLIQFQTARHHPPHLVCCVPRVKDFKTKYSDFYYSSVYRKEHVEGLELLGLVSTAAILAHPTCDLAWQLTEWNSDVAADIAVPMLLIGGWYDHFPDGVLRAYQDLRDKSEAVVRDQHKLLFGPWLHSGVDSAEQGVLFYPDASGVADAMAIRFWDFHLRGIANGWESEPPVRFYQMGENFWIQSDAWDGGERDEKIFYLESGEALTTDFPSAGSPADTFAYDPDDPTPVLGGARFKPFQPWTLTGPQDLTEVVESRGDVLVYSTPVLERDLRVNGSIRIELFVSSDRTDTDFCVRLTDVYPDGRSLIVTQGIKRMRFRNGCENEELMVPGDVYPVTIELQNMALTFLSGHCLRIVVCSADYPHFDKNLNNGGEMYVPGPSYVAFNSVFHDEGFPSRIVISIPSPFDIDGDGAIQTEDLLILAQFLAENLSSLPVYGSGGDVNGDGKVNAVDLILLQIRLL